MREGVTVCMLCCVAVAVFRNCGLWCVGVTLWWSQCEGVMVIHQGCPH